MPTINVTQLIEQIRSQWRNKNRSKLLEGLDNCVLGGATGSEISSRIYGLFNELKSDDADAYIESKKEIDSYLNWINSKEYLKTAEVKID